MIEIVTELPDIGQQAILPNRSVVVSLRWDGDVDLDIIALYVAKDGRTGGVYSKIYPMGDSGDLGSFPFIKVVDGRVTGHENPNEEQLLITTLEPMREVHIAAFSYTDMVLDRTAYLAKYRPRVAVRGAVAGRDCFVGSQRPALTHEVPLACKDPGHMAIICTIKNQDLRRSALKNVSEVLDLEAFRVPDRDRQYGGW